MASKLILTLLVSIFIILIKADGSLKVGDIDDNSKLLYHGNFEAYGILFIKRSEIFDIKLTNGGKIKAIDVQDLRGDGSSWILEGGVDEDFAVVKLESSRSRGYSFTIDVYGYDDDILDKELENSSRDSSEDSNEGLYEKESQEDSLSMEKEELENSPDGLNNENKDDNSHEKESLEDSLSKEKEEKEDNDKENESWEEKHKADEKETEEEKENNTSQIDLTENSQNELDSNEQGMEDNDLSNKDSKEENSLENRIEEGQEGENVNQGSDEE